jgi:tRNA:m4X modification enzyme
MAERVDHHAHKGSKSTPSSTQQQLPPKVPEGWDRCCAYLQEKNRFCHQRPLRGTFCCNHLRSLESPQTKGRKRIPCPIDPSHTIYEDQVVRHTRICPRAKTLRKQAESSYYRSRVNSGGHGKLVTSSEEEPNIEWSKRVALSVLQAYQKIFGNEEVTVLEAEDLSGLTEAQLFDQIPLLDLSKKELNAGFAEAVDHYRIRSGGTKHLIQQASLIGHLRRIGSLPTHTDGASAEKDTFDKISPLVLLEMGAGRGMLGLATTLVACGAGLYVRFVMVERSASRNKADSTLRSNTGNESSNPHQYMKIDLNKIEWSRVQCDLSHVHLPSVLQEGEDTSSSNIESDSLKRNIVVVAKHLCGAGTDLALKSLHPIRNQLKACVIATCCHGVCSWDDYVGRDYLRLAMEDNAISFGPAEFDLLRRWSSGTVKEGNSSCCQKPQRSNAVRGDPCVIQHVDDDAHGEHSVAELGDAINSISDVVKALGLACGVQGLGRACQRLIDHGRCEYMRCVLLPEEQESGSCVTELCHYVPADVTPQNAVLISSYQE